MEDAAKDLALGDVQNAIGYNFRDLSKLEQALTHKSYHHENADRSLGHNERLEFLGDAVLGLILSQYFMERYPERNEGDLSKLRAQWVSEPTLARLALRLKLGQWMKLGNSEIQRALALSPRLLACAWEALLGAIYLDGGLVASQSWVVRQVSDVMNSDGDTEGFINVDFKSALQEKYQAQFKSTPEYRLLGSLGPDHNREFQIEVKLSEVEILAYGSGTTKKAAEQSAAKVALDMWVEAERNKT